MRATARELREIKNQVCKSDWQWRDGVGGSLGGSWTTEQPREWSAKPLGSPRVKSLAEDPMSPRNGPASVSLLAPSLLGAAHRAARRPQTSLGVRAAAGALGKLHSLS